VNRRAIIFGIKGYRLNRREKYLLNKIKPWGIILFSRNIKNLSQLKNLIDDIKKTFKDKKYPILIDQEGGKVSRLNKIIDLSLFSQNYFGLLYKKNKKLFFTVYNIFINKVCDIFNEVGININITPVLDVRRKKTHKVIGSRSFSNEPHDIITLGNLCIKAYRQNKIATVIKHIPGHGLSKFDSHYKMPVIKATKKELIKNDFKTFKLCKSPFAMTGHVVYSVYDEYNTATHSKIIIDDVIRRHINFRGLIISDDISMKSLKYGLIENATRALKAGCNLVLHCNGNLKEMKKLGKVIPKIDKFTQKKTSHFYKFLG
tara:strand:+ start:217 stop:1164 length:948 start_codon:yes stop_codon:yes gene_type:complete